MEDIVATKRHKKHKRKTQLGPAGAKLFCAFCAFLWLLFLAHTPNVESRTKYHNEQEEHGDQHDE
jgi:hypothetical protein